MLIHLKEVAKKAQPLSLSLKLNQRLPLSLGPACELVCDFLLQEMKDYSLLFLEVKGELSIECERCLQNFPYSYHNHTTLALCSSEAMAESLLKDYETIMIEEGQIDLEAILIDELYLYAPSRHLHPEDCDGAIEQFMGTDSEIN